MALLPQMGRRSLDQFHRFSYPYLPSLCSCPLWIVGPLQHCLLNAVHHFLALRIHPTSSIHLVLVFQNVPGVLKYQLLKNKALEIVNLDDGSWNCIIITYHLSPTNFDMSFFNGLAFLPSKISRVYTPGIAFVLGWLDAGRRPNHTRTFLSRMWEPTPDLLSWKIDRCFAWKRYSVLHEITDHSFTGESSHE